MKIYIKESVTLTHSSLSPVSVSNLKRNARLVISQAFQLVEVAGQLIQGFLQGLDYLIISYEMPGALAGN
jgi:hypothetical protein